MGNKVIILPDVRLAFADLWQPRAPGPQSKSGPKYGGNFIFPKESEAYRRAEVAFLEAAKEEYGANWQAFLGAMEASKKCLRNGDRNINAQTGEVRQGFGGMWYLTAKNKQRPVVIAHKFYAPNTPVDIGEDGSAWVKGQRVNDVPFEVVKPYGGCYVNAKVEIGAMKAKGEIAANVFARLLAVQYLRKGDAFGAGPATADGFEDQGGDEGEGSFGAAAAAPAEAGNLFG